MFVTPEVSLLFSRNHLGPHKSPFKTQRNSLLKVAISMNHRILTPDFREMSKAHHLRQPFYIPFSFSFHPALTDPQLNSTYIYLLKFINFIYINLMRFFFLKIYETVITTINITNVVCTSHALLMHPHSDAPEHLNVLQEMNGFP